MGILNVTPDSFSDGGEFYNQTPAIRHAIQLINNGVDIIDVGGESTRPFSKIILPQIELQRVKETIKRFKKRYPKTLLSIDTRKTLIMNLCVIYKLNKI